MREIELYYAKQKFLMDYKEDVFALQDKLSNDLKILQQIRQDYDRDNEVFNLELKKAELAYNTNLLSYCKYIILDFFYNAILTSEDREFDELKSKGWVILCPEYKVTTFDNRSVEEKYQDYFFTAFDVLFSKLIIGQKGSTIDNYFQQCVCSFKNNNYFSCALGLFSIIESLHMGLSGFDGKNIYRIKENLEKVKVKISNLTQPIRTEVKHFQEIVDQINDLITNHYFVKSLPNEDEPQIICRNRIAHGIFTRKVSEKDCLQLFCTVKTMNELIILKTADDNMKSIQPILKQKQEELKLLLKKSFNRKEDENNNEDIH